MKKSTICNEYSSLKLDGPACSNDGQSGCCCGSNACRDARPDSIARFVGSIMSSCHARSLKRSSRSVRSSKSVPKLVPSSDRSCPGRLPTSSTADELPLAVGPLVAAPLAAPSEPLAVPPSAMLLSTSMSAEAVAAPAGGAAGLFACWRRMTWIMYGSRSLSSASMRPSSFSSRPSVIMRSMRACSGCHSPWPPSCCQMRIRSVPTV